MSRALPAYMLEQVYDFIAGIIHPDDINCHLLLKTHNWGAGNHGWATKECHDCGRKIEGCGL